MNGEMAKSCAVCLLYYTHATSWYHIVPALGICATKSGNAYQPEQPMHNCQFRNRSFAYGITSDSLSCAHPSNHHQSLQGMIYLRYSKITIVNPYCLINHYGLEFLVDEWVPCRSNFGLQQALVETQVALERNDKTVPGRHNNHQLRWSWPFYHALPYSTLPVTSTKGSTIYIYIYIPCASYTFFF